VARLSAGLPWAKKEAHAGDRLPYLALVDENVLLLRDGSVMLSLLVPGLAFETADSGELNAHAATRELLLRSALDARFVLYHHVIRRRVRVELDAAFDDPVAAHIDARWREKLGHGSLYVNDQFITLVRRPARGKAGWADRIGRRMKRRGSAPTEADPSDIRALRAAAASIAASLSAYGARLLGDYDGNAGPCSEVLELLSALYNGEMRPVRRPADGSDVGRMLPYRRVSFGLDAIELRGAGASEFASLLSLKDYPDSTAPGLIDALLRLPCELVLTESYAPADRQIARERIDLAVRRLKSADEEAFAERREMQAARDALGVGAVGFGDHHLTVLVRSDRLDTLDETTAACAAALAEAGAVAVREDVNLEPAFWGQFPGNEGYLVRRALISSANMACFGSLNKRLVDSVGEHADPLTVTALELGAGTLALTLLAPLMPAIFPVFAGPLLLVPGGSDAIYLLLLALGCTLLPFALSLVALRHMSAFSAQLAVNLEPVYAIVLAIVLLGEQHELAGMFYLGVAVILAAVFVHPWLSRTRRLEHPETLATSEAKGIVD